MHDTTRLQFAILLLAAMNGPLSFQLPASADEDAEDKATLVQTAPPIDLSVSDWQGRSKDDSKSLSGQLAALGKKRTDVVSASFELHELTDDDVTALRSLPNLRRVSICGSNTTDATVERVCQVPNLRQLSFHGTRITDKGLESIKRLGKLQTLSISDGWKNISDAGLSHLAELTELRELWLSAGAIGDKGLAFLEKLTELRSVALYAGQLKGEGLQHLKNLKNLESLDLRGPGVTNAGLEHLKGLTSLRRLNLYHANVGDDAVKLLQRALPDCTITRDEP